MNYFVTVKPVKGKEFRTVQACDIWELKYNRHNWTWSRAKFRPKDEDNFNKKEEYGIIQEDVMRKVYLLAMAETKPALFEKLSKNRSAPPVRWSLGPDTIPLKDILWHEEKAALKEQRGLESSQRATGKKAADAKVIDRSKLVNVSKVDSKKTSNNVNAKDKVGPQAGNSSSNESIQDSDANTIQGNSDKIDDDISRESEDARNTNNDIEADTCKKPNCIFLQKEVKRLRTENRNLHELLNTTLKGMREDIKKLPEKVSSASPVQAYPWEDCSKFERFPVPLKDDWADMEVPKNVVYCGQGRTLPLQKILQIQNDYATSFNARARLVAEEILGKSLALYASTDRDEKYMPIDKDCKDAVMSILRNMNWDEYREGSKNKKLHDLNAAKFQSFWNQEPYEKRRKKGLVQTKKKNEKKTEEKGTTGGEKRKNQSDKEVSDNGKKKKRVQQIISDDEEANDDNPSRLVKDSDGNVIQVLETQNSDDDFTEYINEYEGSDNALFRDGLQ